MLFAQPSLLRHGRAEPGGALPAPDHNGALAQRIRRGQLLVARLHTAAVEEQRSAAAEGEEAELLPLPPPLAVLVELPWLVPAPPGLAPGWGAPARLVAVIILGRSTLYLRLYYTFLALRGFPGVPGPSVP